MTDLDTTTMHQWPHQPPSEPPTSGYPGTPGPPVAPAPPSPNAQPPAGSSGPPPGGFPYTASPFGGGPVSPPPPKDKNGGSNRRGLIITAAILASIALLAGAFLMGSRVGKPDEAASGSPSSTAAGPTSTTPRSSAPATTTSPPTTDTSPSTSTPRSGGGSSSPVDDAAVKAEVAKLSKYVEQDRGLTFKNPVDVTVLAPDAFKARALQEFDKDTEHLRQQGQFLQALGLIDANADPVQVQKDLLGEGVLGFYDPITKVLVVKGEKIGPFFREIVVHELTHAIDDQNFNLNRPEIDKRTDGSEWAWLALVEGSARRVEYDYVRQLPAAEKEALVQEMMSMAGGAGALESGAMPLALALIIQSPYDYGEPFVRDVLQRHGQPGLDKAFSDPPTTSEQILQPEKYESRETAKSVDKPQADGQPVTDGTMGEIMTGFLVNGQVSLDDILDKILGGNIDPSDPNSIFGSILGGNTDDPTKLNDLGALFGKADKVKNWGGDHYVMYKTGSELCVRVDWTMDSPGDTQNLRTQLNTWAQKDGRGKVESLGDKTRMTRCIASSSSSGGGGSSPATDPGKAG